MQTDKGDPGQADGDYCCNAKGLWVFVVVWLCGMRRVLGVDGKISGWCEQVMRIGMDEERRQGASEGGEAGQPAGPRGRAAMTLEGKESGP